MNSNVTSPALAVFSCLIAGCASKGELEGPLGPFELRTALYRVSPENLSLVLSNGLFSCGLPSEEVEGEIDKFHLAGCREGAQTVLLRLYGMPGLPIDGTYAGANDAEEKLGDLLPRTANASYYGVKEAILAIYENLRRGYQATEEVRRDPIGDGGSVGVEAEDDGTLSGWLDIPMGAVDGTLTGHFRATECTGDDSLIDTLGDNLEFYCDPRDLLTP
jgi:hypothetical protein